MNTGIYTRIYRDDHNGGWVAQYRYYGERGWIHCGTFATRGEAVRALG